MRHLDPWPAPPSCRHCFDWFAGYEAGYIAGDRDARVQIVAERLDEQRWMAAQIESSDSIVQGLRALRARSGGGGACGNA